MYSKSDLAEHSSYRSLSAKSAMKLCYFILIILTGHYKFSCFKKSIRTISIESKIAAIRRHSLTSQFSLTESLSDLRRNLDVPPEAILNALDKVSLDKELSAGNVAASAGVDLDTTRASLMTLSTLVGGDMLVTNDGEILFKFPKDFRLILSQRSGGQKIRNAYSVLAPYFFYILRASFGIALLTSLAILASTAVVVMNSSSNNQDSENRNKRNDNAFGSSGGFPSMNFNGFFDVFFFRPYYGYYYSDVYAPSFLSTRSAKSGGMGPSMSFIESFFSFVFGDGNPNEGKQSTVYSIICKLYFADSDDLCYYRLLANLNFF